MYKIAIDAGHGSKTAGKRTPKLPDGTVIREHIANVGVAQLVEYKLSKLGFETLRVGWNDAISEDDADIGLSARQKLIKKEKCDIVVSIHFNAHGNGNDFTSAEGVGLFIHSTNKGDSAELAKVILKYLAQGTKQKNRGVKAEAFAMVNCKTMGVKAAVLAELAFMTNLKEAQLMREYNFWEECATEIVKGVCEYTGVPYKK